MKHYIIYHNKMHEVVAGVLIELSLDDKLEIAEKVMGDTTIYELSKDENYGVRAGVAINPNTSTYLLEVLSKDEDWHVRNNVAKNPNTPKHVLRALIRDEHPSVSFKAIIRLPILIN